MSRRIYDSGRYDHRVTKSKGGTVTLLCDVPGKPTLSFELYFSEAEAREVGGALHQASMSGTEPPVIHRHTSSTTQRSMTNPGGSGTEPDSAA